MPSNRQRSSALRYVGTAAPGCPGGYGAPFTKASEVAGTETITSAPIAPGVEVLELEDPREKPSIAGGFSTLGLSTLATNDYAAVSSATGGWNGSS
jgi:hypothetical protein